MKRHHHVNPDMHNESSSDEEDAFLALSCKSKRAKTASVPSSNQDHDPSKNDETDTTGTNNNAKAMALLPVSITSSTKRHHGIMTDKRKEKMDSLLEELEAEKRRATTEPQDDPRKGSFVDPREEHITTNIFVGNLAPTITEEDFAGVFRQFGEHQAAVS